MNESDKARARQMRTPDKYGKRFTLQQVADKFGVTRERIRQICGNSKSVKSVALKLLSKKKGYWARRLYLKRDITLKELQELTCLSRKSIQRTVGSRFSFEKKTGKRRCNDCDKLKPIEVFCKNGVGISRLCPKCNGARTSNWIANHRERFNETSRLRQQTPKYKKYAKDYQKKHKKEIVKRRRKWYLKNRTEILRKMRERYAGVKGY